MAEIVETQVTRMEQYEAPRRTRYPDGSARYAFVTFLMMNDSYLAGALVLAYALRKQETQADLVCLITDEITSGAQQALRMLFDRVILVDKVFVPHQRRQERQDRPYLMTRLNALRLGPDGDLGCRYHQIVMLDADLLPLRHYDHLFSLDTPAGIINETKSHVVEIDDQGQYVIPPSVRVDGTWRWHRIYGGICPHGAHIPAEITDRVRLDPANMGINSSLLVLEPSMREFEAMLKDVRRPEILELIGSQFNWPEMQYLTMYWSGRWTNVDLRFSGFNGYPMLSVLFGTHYAGFKPWSFKKSKAMARWARYDDFRLWFHEYQEMTANAYPGLRGIRRLDRLLRNVQEMVGLTEETR
jgi:alpha-N-acetylglucosamine transferase